MYVMISYNMYNCTIWKIVDFCGSECEADVSVVYNSGVMDLHAFIDNNTQKY